MGQWPSPRLKLSGDSLQRSLPVSGAAGQESCGIEYQAHTAVPANGGAGDSSAIAEAAHQRLDYDGLLPDESIDQQRDPAIIHRHDDNFLVRAGTGLGGRAQPSKTQQRHRFAVEVRDLIAMDLMDVRG